MNKLRFWDPKIIIIWPKTYVEESRTGRTAVRLGRQLRSAHTTEEQRDHPDSAAAAGEFDGWLRSVVYHKKTGCAQSEDAGGAAGAVCALCTFVAQRCAKSSRI